jgi:hypothetical protein
VSNFVLPAIALSPKEARQLPQEAFVEYLISTPISNARRYLELARYSTRKHEKKEMLAGAIIGTALGIWLGGGTWQGGIGVGLLGFFGTLLLLFFLHWIHSPSVLYQAAVAQIKERDKVIAQFSERKIWITFEPKPPFIDRYSVGAKQADLFRVRVHSSVGGEVFLYAEEVEMKDDVGMRTFDGVFLRPTNKNPPVNKREFHPNEKWMWDIIEKRPEFDTLLLIPADPDYQRNLGRNTKFRIIASNQNANLHASKIITAKLTLGGTVRFDVDDDPDYQATLSDVNVLYSRLPDANSLNNVSRNR